MRPSASRGQIIPFVALSLTVMLAFTALGIDVGYWRYEHQVQQAAADSAAIAGAVSLSYLADATTVTAAARTDASGNGFVHNGTTVNVTVNAPPASGSYAGNHSAVEVIVSKRQPAFFAQVFGQTSQVVSARAVALLSDPGRTCIYGLSSSGTSVSMSGSTVSMPKCGVISNGDLSMTGSTVSAVSVGYAGTFSGSAGGGTVPRKSLPASDPCPTIAGCAYLTANPPVPGTCMPSTFSNLSNVTINPGTYCSRLTISGSDNVTFAPGLYLLENGITVNGASTVSGTGVTFYDSGGSETINAATTSLTAPTTGLTAGMLFYQVASDAGTLTYNGSKGSGLAGAVYFPNAQLTLNGSLTNWSLVIGASIRLNGSTADVGGSAFPGITHAVLAE